MAGPCQHDLVAKHPTDMQNLPVNFVEGYGLNVPIRQPILQCCRCDVKFDGSEMQSYNDFEVSFVHQLSQPHF